MDQGALNIWIIICKHQLCRISFSLCIYLKAGIKISVLLELNVGQYHCQRIAGAFSEHSRFLIQSKSQLLRCFLHQSDFLAAYISFPVEHIRSSSLRDACQSRHIQNCCHISHSVNACGKLTDFPFLLHLFHKTKAF